MHDIHSTHTSHRILLPAYSYTWKLEIPLPPPLVLYLCFLFDLQHTILRPCHLLLYSLRFSLSRAMATVATARMIRGQPPSPPHSTDGDPAPEVHRNSCGTLQQAYSHHNPYASSMLHGNRAPGDISYEHRSHSLVNTPNSLHGRY